MAESTRVESRLAREVVGRRCDAAEVNEREPMEPADSKDKIGACNCLT
jgi:hypothetical protein